MTITETINEDLKTAMKARDESKTRALRLIKSALLLLATSGQSEPISEVDEIKTLQKMAKQRKDSIEIFKAQNRNDLAEIEIAELEVIEMYLPKMMGETEIKSYISNIIEQTQASGLKDIGKVMPKVIQGLAGKAEGKLISDLVKQMLS